MTAGAAPLVRLENVVKRFPVHASRLFSRSTEQVHAVSGVTLDIMRGETLGLVGETGCGKSTLARCILRLHELTAGRITYDGHDLSSASRSGLRPLRRRMQMVFQDPNGSLNPRRRVGSIIGDPFAIHGVADGEQRRQLVQQLMELVGLDPEHTNRFPGEFSGGQRQRVGIARAIALKPEFLVCDEPVSALDVSIQAQLLNLLTDLQRELGLTYLFISHNLSVVRHMSDRVAVMYLGSVVELAPVHDLFAHARHPYTRALLSTIPDLSAHRGAPRAKVLLAGEPPSPIHPPTGCRFHPRCPRAQRRCAVEEPLLVPRFSDLETHRTACHFPLATGDTMTGDPSHETRSAPA